MTRKPPWVGVVVGCVVVAAFCAAAIYAALERHGYFWAVAVLTCILCGATLVPLLVTAFGAAWLRAHPERLSGRVPVNRGLWWRVVRFELPWSDVRVVRVAEQWVDVGESSSDSYSQRRVEQLVVKTAGESFAFPWVFVERIDDIADTIREHMRAHGGGTASPRAGAKKRKRRRPPASDEAT
ncbi:MAG: hypothetical protein HY908_27255 [Myxococcales bacterium]|nr:hypothetical protein [Myxococcales bacterium]